VKRLLEGKGISEETVEKCYKEVISTNPYACRMSPLHIALCIELLEREKEGEVQVYISELPREELIDRFLRKRSTITIAILAPDWPGLLDSCTSIIHEEEFNLFYSESFVFRGREKDYGFVLMEVEMLSREIVHRLAGLRTEIEEKLTRAAILDQAKKGLLKSEIRKLDEYSRVVEILKKISHPEELEGLISDEGEAVRFFGARSEAYIRERRPEDIAWQILTNFRFQQGIRRVGGGILVKIRNLEVTGSALTGISLAALEKEVSLGDCLRVLEEIIPGYQRKHDKAFFTLDGIIVIRIEVTDSQGNAFSPELQMKIIERLKRIREERIRVEFSPGLELLSRKIIPPMLEEERELKIPQVYMHPHSWNEFKIVIISSGEDRKKVKDCLRQLDRIKGLICALPDTPSIFRYREGEVEVQQQVDIIGIRVNFEEFFGRSKGPYEEEKIFSALEETLRKVEDIGSRLRIFDRTTRVLRQSRWERIKPMLERAKVDLTRGKEIFYRLGDKRLMDSNISDSVIFEEIEFGVKTWKDFERKKEKTLSSQFKKIIPQLGGEEKGYTLLALVALTKDNLLDRTLEALKDFEVDSFSRLDEGGDSLLLFRITKGLNPLSAQEERELLKRLDSI